jgi:hypothetical protein
MSFALNLLRTHAKNIKNALTSATILVDKEAASEAEIATIEESLDSIMKKMAEASIEMQREENEAAYARTMYDRYKTAALKLNEGYKVNQEPSTAAALTEALNWLEANKDEVLREESEAKEAREYFDELKATAEILRDKLLNARKDVETAKKTLERAELREERAKIKADNAAVIAGIRESATVYGEAQKAMLEKAKEKEINAKAMETKTEMLKPSSSKNSILEQALSGTPAPSASADDRLANL